MYRSLVAAIVGMLRHLAVRSRRDDWEDAAHEQIFSEPVAVIALVRQQRPGAGPSDHRPMYNPMLTTIAPDSLYC